MPVRVKRVAAVVVVGALAVGGCSSDKDTGASEAKRSPSASQSSKPSKSAEPSKPAEPAEPTSPSPSPTGPLPKAKDGKNTGACTDGNCEILVTKPVDVVIGDGFLHVSVAVSTITLMRFDSGDFLGYVTFGEGGQATFPTADDKRTTVDAIAANKDSAVLKFRTK